MQTFLKFSVSLAYAAVIVNAVEIQTRITHGDQVDIKDFPYQLSFWTHFKNNHTSTFQCGAVLIRADLALTAAHCCSAFRNGNIELLVKAGSTSLNKGESRHVECCVHPRYVKYGNGKAVNDIAVLKLKTPYSVGPSIRPVKLPNCSVKENQWGWLSGWGATLHIDYTDGREHETTGYPTKLRAVRVPVVPLKECQRDYQRLRNVTVSPTMFCAGNRVKIQSSCAGDEGGPFVVDGTLYGIVSSDDHCGNFGLPAVLTNVFLAMDFIQQYLI